MKKTRSRKSRVSVPFTLYDFTFLFSIFYLIFSLNFLSSGYAQIRNCVPLDRVPTCTILLRGGHFRQNSDIPKAIGLRNSYRNIGLTYLSDFSYWKSQIGFSIVRWLSELLKSFGQKMGIFYVIFHEFFAILMTCWRISSKKMSFWHSCGAVGVPAEASTVAAGLPSAVDAVMFLLSQLLWPPSMLLLASLFFARIASILCWRSCCCFHSCCSQRSCCCERS